MAKEFDKAAIDDFNPLAGFQPQSSVETQMVSHIDQLLLNLRIAAENLEEVIRKRGKE